MKVIDTLEMVGDRLQVAMVVCNFPEKGGDLEILYTNSPAAFLFGYTAPSELVGADVRSLMPESIAKQHSAQVTGYKDRYAMSGGHAARQGSIMGQWRDLQGVRKDGTLCDLQANVADIKNSEERYFVAIFRDRSIELERESNLAAKVDEIEALRTEAEAAKRDAQEALLKEKKLTGQISLLRQIFLGTVGLVAMLGALIIASWVTGNKDSKDALAMIERVLLVMTGILGSAMASVFDSRNKSTE